MKNDRRNFIKLAGRAGLGLAGAGFFPVVGRHEVSGKPNPTATNQESHGSDMNMAEDSSSIIGPYGPWASSLNRHRLPAMSLRREEWTDLESWRNSARNRLAECMAIPDIGGLPEVTVTAGYEYDGLHIEELSWQLPYGRKTEAILMKPAGVQEPLPAVLAFYEHGGQKYFGVGKITRTGSQIHPVIRDEQQQYYEGMAWANEIAKRGYVVLVPDVFPFGSRRVKLQDVPEEIRRGLDEQSTGNPADESPEYIQAYNQWAAQHEHIMAKSLFSAGTTWPGVFFAEDRKSLDILCAREDVDASRVGCGGLSGGGIRTVFMAGLDPRIKCTFCVGFMTTWQDLILHKSYTHTWMTYVPLIPNDLGFPEILGLRAPMPTMVLNCDEDPLFTYSEMKKADRIMQDVFELSDAADRYQCNFHPGGHKFDKKMQGEAFDWLDRWL